MLPYPCCLCLLRPLPSRCLLSLPPWPMVHAGSGKYTYATKGGKYTPDQKRYALEAVLGLADFDQLEERTDGQKTFRLAATGQLARFKKQLKDLHPTAAEARQKKERKRRREESQRIGGASGARQYKKSDRSSRMRMRRRK